MNKTKETIAPTEEIINLTGPVTLYNAHIITYNDEKYLICKQQDWFTCKGATESFKAALLNKEFLTINNPETTPLNIITIRTRDIKELRITQEKNG